MIILVIFAALGSIGFGRSLAALLGMSTILSAVIGTMRREPLEPHSLHFALRRPRAILCGSYEIAVLPHSNSYLAAKILRAAAPGTRTTRL